jgi:amino acid adenylation domain-containing protein
MSKKEELEQRKSNLSPAKRALLEKWKRGENKTVQPLIPQRPDPNFAPLSFAQQRLWLIEQITPNTAAYNIPLAIRLIGQLNIKALHNSLNEIIYRHEVLRTIFTTVNGEPIQEIISELSLPLPVVDLQQIPESERETEILKVITTETQQPFDLSIAPLLRVTLLQINEQEYVLLLVMHHIISDGWSMGVLVRELATLYKSSTPSPPALPIQYADFAVWQRDWLQGDALDRQLSYWKQQLAGSLPVLELPTDRPRPLVSTFQGSKYSFIIPQSVTGALAALSVRSGVTLFMTLLAAFQTLLYRYTGQSDICVGTPIANRNRTEIEGLIGFFVNTLVLRNNLEENPTFRELLLQVKEVTLGAYAHQDLPFEKLVEELQPERSINHNPIFQVMFALQNAPMPEIQLSDLTLSLVDIESGTAQFDLSLSIVETEAGLIASFEYNKDLFDTETIVRMAAHFQTLLESVVVNPDVRISMLSLLTETERQQLLTWGTGLSKKSTYTYKCIHHLFEQQVKLTPEAIAVEYEKESLTYCELNSRANKLAHYLQKQGVQPEVRVGIFVERSLDLLVGMLGILKAGGAYVPLDVNYPAERLALILEDTQAPLLVTKKAWVERLPFHDASVVCLDTDWLNIDGYSDQNPNSNIKPENLVYVIYTSGSTGKPKGVAIEHKSLVDYTETAIQAYDIKASERILQFASISFDTSAEEIYSCLASGATLILRTDEMITSVSQFLKTCEDWGITVLNLPTAYWHELTANLEAEIIPASIRLVIIGGERVLPERIAQWRRCVGESVSLINTYGPTETTIVATMNKITEISGNCSSHSEASIGKPIPNAQTYVLDKHLQLVPAGVSGELYIGGGGLARGYLNQPELTAQKFITNPFSAELGARLYKTGDLVCLRTDGTIEFLGRIDDQVKIRGFRIELREIESVLKQHPSVQEAIAIVQTNKFGDKRLVTYIIVKEQIPTSRELRNFLLQSLPEYMLPQAFIILEKLPLTPNGKVDRLTLISHQPTEAVIASTNVNSANDIALPRDTAELQLTQIWEEILNIRPIGVNDNFFELGGHSLLALRLVTKINQSFGKQIPLGSIFQGATIAQMANILRQEIELNSNSPLVAIKTGSSSRRPFFCVHPSGGSVMCYVDLAHHLHDEQPFYGLQVAPTNAQPFNIIDMASRYITAIRTIQPDGPYLLGGWSMGGIVAFEMAQQLQQQGHSVSKLILLDTTAKTNDTAFTLNDNLEVLASFALDIGMDLEKFNFCSEKLRQLTPDEQLQIVLSSAKDANLLPPDIELAQVRHLLEIFQSNVSAMSKYIPQAYPGQIVLFKASETLTEVEDKDLTMGWGQLAALGVEIQTIPGNHYSIIKKPHVQILAQHLNNHLN